MNISLKPSPQSKEPLIKFFFIEETGCTFFSYTVFPKGSFRLTVPTPCTATRALFPINKEEVHPT
jgi:hypothetical protein